MSRNFVFVFLSDIFIALRQVKHTPFIETAKMGMAYRPLL